MTESIIVALISVTGTLIVCLLNNNAQNKKIRADFETHYEKTNALMEYKIDELTKQVSKHNSIVERTFALEKAVTVLEERQKVANNRIDDLEEKTK